MKLKKFLFNLTITITAIQSSALYTQDTDKGIVKKFATSHDTDQFTRLTLTISKLLQTCRSSGIVSFGLIRDHLRFTRWSEAFLDTFTLVQFKYLILSENEQFVPLRRCAGLYRYKLDAFIVIAATAKNLGYMLKRLRNTKWQNSEGLFVTFDGSTVNSGCRNAESYLRYTWELNILHAVFICLDSTGEIFIYTYNPFMDRAPHLWQEVQTSENDAQSPAWTLFKRKFILGEITCADLMFDKESQLNGYAYKLLAVHLPPPFAVNEDAKKGVTYSGLDPKIHTTFTQHVNATPSFTVLPIAEADWYEPNNLIANVSREEYDILGNSVYNFNKEQAALTYPHRYTGLAILTKSAGLQSGHAKIVHFMNPKLIGLIAVIYVVTIFILGILNRYGITTAFLEVTRLMTNSSMTRRIERAPLRIYLFPVFLLFLISNATFQGKLSAILIRPLVKPNIETLEDLQASDMLSYACTEYQNVINDTLLSNLRIIHDWNCSRFVINEENSACLGDRYELMKVVVDTCEHHLYLSSRDILSLTSAYVVKPFWPLKHRFNEIITRLFMSGILDLWKRQDAQIFAQSYQIYWTILNDRSFRILRIEDLKFAFFSLIIGLGCSIFVFFIECTISCYKKHADKKDKLGSTTFSFVE